jgi:hypothetical protein
VAYIIHSSIQGAPSSDVSVAGIPEFIDLRQQLRLSLPDRVSI